MEDKIEVGEYVRTEKAKEKTKQWIYNMKTGCRVNIIHKGDKDFCNDLEILLQYIDKLEQENKDLKKENDQLENQIEAKEMEHKYDVNMIDEVKGEAVKLYKEIDKQNKIIEEMALAIASYDIDEEICKNQVMPLCDKSSLEVTVDVCVKCLKQYFEEKVEENAK